MQVCSCGGIQDGAGPALVVDGDVAEEISHGLAVVDPPDGL